MNFSPGLNFIEKLISNVAAHVPGDCVAAGIKFEIKISLVSHCDCAFLVGNDSTATANRRRKNIFILLWLNVKKNVCCIAVSNTFSQEPDQFYRRIRLLRGV